MTSTASHTRSRRRYQRIIRQLEELEPRTLLSADVTSYAIGGVAANFAAYDSSGALWVVDGYSNGNGLSLEKIISNGTESSVGAVIPLDPQFYAPTALVGGANGHLYMIESFGIDDVNTATGEIRQNLFAQSSSSTYLQPVALAVTGNGAVWFVGAGAINTESGAGGLIITHHTNVIGRIDPNAFMDAPVTLPTSDFSDFDDSVAVVIASSGSDSVWIGLNAAEDQNAIGDERTFGTNRIAAASFNGSISVNKPWRVDTGDTGDATSAQANYITSIVNGPDGGVWFTLANLADSYHPLTGPDEIVHGVINAGSLTQTAFVVDSNATTPLFVGGLNFDAEGNLWFIESSGPNLGCLTLAADGSGTITPIPLASLPTDPTVQQVQTAVKGDGSQLSIITINGDPDAGNPIIQVDVNQAPVVFSGIISDVAIQEDTAMDSKFLGYFASPSATGAYSVTISWGDGTTTTVTPEHEVGSDYYDIYVSGKSFATQGTYSGLITVTDIVGADSTVVGTLDFTTTVSDIPLDITSFTAAQQGNGPLVMAQGTFTDDAGLKPKTWTALIDWGDGTVSTATVSPNLAQPGTYIIHAVHKYRIRQQYTVSLNLTTSELGGVVESSTASTTVIGGK